MIIRESFSIPAPRDDVAAFFQDPERLLSCVPGVEKVIVAGDGAFQATLRTKVGPIRAAFTGTVRIDDSGAPERFVAVGEGKDTASGSLAKVTLSARLSGVDAASTTIESEADLAIRGRLGQFGTGVIEAIAGEMVTQFVACASARILDPETTAPTHATSNLAAIAMRGVAKEAVAKLRRQEG